MTTAVYLRVSTDSQDELSQRAAVDAWLSKQPPSKVTWYVDRGISGAQAKRPALDRLSADVAAGKAGIVVVFALDRLSRDIVDGLTFLTNWLKAGARVVSLSEPVDWSGGIVAEIMAAVLFAMAKLNLAQIRARIKAGIWAARQADEQASLAAGRKITRWQGRKPGTAKVAGAGRDPAFNAKLRCAQHARIVELRGKGLTPQEIGKIVGLSGRTVRRRLHTA